MPATLQMPQLVSTREAAKILDISTRTLYEIEKSGELRATRIHRCVKYSVDDLRDYISRQSGATKAIA